MKKEHYYSTQLKWTGNQGAGTQSYRAYDRNFEIAINEGLHPILGSSDPAFLGDPSRYNPEELLLASLSSCHMLWYLHLCAAEGFVVTHYEDQARATMVETKDGGGHFVSAVLAPLVSVVGPLDDAKTQRISELHQLAGKRCFIANSINFPLTYRPELITAS